MDCSGDVCRSRHDARSGVLVRDFFLPARVVGGGSGKKYSLHAKSRPKSAFWGVLGEFYTGWAAELGVLGEFYTGWAAEPGVLGEFYTGYGPARSCRMNSGS